MYAAERGLSRMELGVGGQQKNQSCKRRGRVALRRCSPFFFICCLTVSEISSRMLFLFAIIMTVNVAAYVRRVAVRYSSGFILESDLLFTRVML